jgi:sialate O-acetylesterase
MLLTRIFLGLSTTGLILATASPSSASDLTLGAPFQDHAVRQRDTPMTIWGTAASGAPVTITVGGRTATTPDPGGRWTATLPALPASGPHTLEASAGPDATRSANERLRLFTIPHIGRSEPALSFERMPSWQAADPKGVRAFSAACYFMGREIQEAQQVPVGLIHASWEGTAIEPWIGSSALDAGAYAEALERK